MTILRLSLLLTTLALLACDRPVAQPATPSSTTPAPTTAAPTVVAPTPPPSSAVAPPSSTAASAARTLTFDQDTIGGPASQIEGVVGDWSILERDGARGLFVDGSRWRSGEASASIADQAQRLYGDRYAEFLDGVRAYAFFPLAVVRDAPPSGDLRISVRFFPIDGRIDQAAGIAFAIRPDGSYLGLRANALEDNALFFRVERGRRTILETIRGVETTTRQWHTLAVELRGTALRATLDDRVIYEHTLDATPVGLVGLWSKADSQVLFDDLRIEPLAP